MHSQRINQRRRRVTLERTQSDESLAETPVADPVSNEPRRPASRPYSQGARRSRQFKTTDLLPKRIWSVAAVIALLLAAIAGLNLLHLNSPGWVQVIGEEGVEVFSLDSGRGLGVWYSNFLLLLTSCVSLQLFLLRQHRRDDYRGSYRIWLWLALIFLIASASSVTGIAATFRNLVSNTLGSGTPESTLIWVFLIKLTGLTLLIVRGLVEVRHSRLAVFALLIVLLSYGTAHLINEVPSLQTQSTQYIHGSLGNCLLVGCTALFVAVVGYARYVYLNANGLILARDNSQNEEKREARAARRVAAKRKKEDARQQKLEQKEAARQKEVDGRKARKQQKREAAEARKTRPSTTEPAAEETQSDSRQGSRATADADTATSRRNKKSATTPSSSRSANRNTLKARTERRSTPSAEAATSSSKRVPRPPDPVTAADVNKASGDDYLMSVEDDDVDNLSKAERRRLRKLKRRSQNRAA